MEPAPEQGEVRIRFVTKELAVPDPGAAGRRLLGRDHEHWSAIDFEIEPFEAKPARTFARELDIHDRMQPHCDRGRVMTFRNSGVKPCSLAG